MYIHTTDHMAKCWEGAFVANWVEIVQIRPRRNNKG
jgi:hypothetical protein